MILSNLCVYLNRLSASDGLDNDNDGLIDGNDIDCPAPYDLAFEISCDQGQEAKDINGDGVADECQPT